MKLYASPFACSLAPHIVLHETGHPHEIAWVRLRTKELLDGGSYFNVNPKGKISAIERDDGTILTENVAVLCYLGSVDAEKNLVPMKDRDGFLRLMEWLNFVSTEIHKQILWTSFSPATPDEMKRFVTGEIAPKVLSHAERALEAAPFLMGEDFTVADAYFFWSLQLLPRAGVALEPYPSILAFRDRIAARPTVACALSIEHKVKAEMDAAAEAAA